MVAAPVPRVEVGDTQAPLREGALRARGTQPIRELGLRVEGTRLAAMIEAIQTELEERGVRRLRPRFYLSTEWGVPFGTIAIAIPFYLGSPELTALHAERNGHVEGETPRQILQYLRHEVGHVVGYAYRLYADREWIRLFGSIERPYVEEYRPMPFSDRYVRHLPGWYAQKHPDEDWAETFAVWLTPGLDWRQEYEGTPALEKLIWCDQTMAQIGGLEPVVALADVDEDVAEIEATLDEYYGHPQSKPREVPRGLSGSLRAIFLERSGWQPSGLGGAPADRLIRRCAREISREVFVWTGHFPERIRALLDVLAERAEQLGLGYLESCETDAVIALTALVTALAMNWIRDERYVP